MPIAPSPSAAFRCWALLLALAIAIFSSMLITVSTLSAKCHFRNSSNSTVPEPSASRCSNALRRPFGVRFTPISGAILLNSSLSSIPEPSESYLVKARFISRIFSSGTEGSDSRSLMSDTSRSESGGFCLASILAFIVSLSRNHQSMNSSRSTNPEPSRSIAAVRRTTTSA